MVDLWETAFSVETVIAFSTLEVRKNVVGFSEKCNTFLCKKVIHYQRGVCQRNGFTETVSAFCSVLQSVVLCCRVLYCVAAWCRCCSVKECAKYHSFSSTLQINADC